MTFDAVAPQVIAGVLVVVILGVVAAVLPPVSRKLFVAWAWIASRPWPRDVRERRVEEARSFAWEQFHNPDDRGRSRIELAAILLIKTFWTMPGDAIWTARMVARRGRRQSAVQATLVLSSGSERISLSVNEVVVKAVPVVMDLSKVIPPNPGHGPKEEDPFDGLGKRVHMPFDADDLGNRSERRRKDKQRSRRKTGRR